MTKDNRFGVYLEEGRLTVDTKDAYETVSTTISLEEGREYFLCYVTYTTGNSFGRDECPCYDFVDVYEKREDADTAAQKIREHMEETRGYGSYKSGLTHDDKHRVSLQMANGSKVEYWCPWQDYFAADQIIYTMPVRLNSSGGKKKF